MLLIVKGGLSRAGPVLFPGILGLSAYGTYKHSIDSGQGKLTGLTKAIGLEVAAYMAPWATAAAFAFPFARMGAGILTDSIGRHNNFIRHAKTPFSHRFEHSDMTAGLQARGMRAISASWAHSRFGSEAGAFARRYGR